MKQLRIYCMVLSLVLVLAALCGGAGALAEETQAESIDQLLYGTGAEPKDCIHVDFASSLTLALYDLDGYATVSYRFPEFAEFKPNASVLGGDLSTEMQCVLPEGAKHVQQVDMEIFGVRAEDGTEVVLWRGVLKDTGFVPPVIPGQEPEAEPAEPIPSVARAEFRAVKFTAPEGVSSPNSRVLVIEGAAELEFQLGEKNTYEAEFNGAPVGKQNTILNRKLVITPEGGFTDGAVLEMRIYDAQDGDEGRTLLAAIRYDINHPNTNTVRYSQGDDTLSSHDVMQDEPVVTDPDVVVETPVNDPLVKDENPEGNESNNQDDVKIGDENNNPNNVNNDPAIAGMGEEPTLPTTPEGPNHEEPNLEEPNPKEPTLPTTPEEPNLEEPTASPSPAPAPEKPAGGSAKDKKHSKVNVKGADKPDEDVSEDGDDEDVSTINMDTDSQDDENGQGIQDIQVKVYLELEDGSKYEFQPEAIRPVLVYGKNMTVYAEVSGIEEDAVEWDLFLNGKKTKKTLPYENEVNNLNKEEETTLAVEYTAGNEQGILQLKVIRIDLQEYPLKLDEVEFKDEQVQGRAWPGAMIELMVNGEAVNPEAPITAHEEDGSFSAVLPAPLDPNALIEVKAVDENGVERSIDVLVPVPEEWTTIAFSAKRDETGKVTVSGEAEAGEALLLSIDENPSAGAPFNANADGTFSHSFQLPDGEYRICVHYAREGLDQFNGESRSYDWKAPEITLDEEGLVAGATLVQGKVDEKATVTFELLDAQGNLRANDKQSVGDADGSFSFSLKAMKAGTLEPGMVIRISAEDIENKSAPVEYRVESAVDAIVVIESPRFGGEYSYMEPVNVRGYIITGADIQPMLSLPNALGVETRIPLIEDAGMIAEIDKDFSDRIIAERCLCFDINMDISSLPIGDNVLSFSLKSADGKEELRVQYENAGDDSGELRILVVKPADFLPKRVFLLAALLVGALLSTIVLVRTSRKIRLLKNSRIDSDRNESSLTINKRIDR